MTEYTGPEQSSERDSSSYLHLLHDEVEPLVAWHVLWTRSNFEKSVHDQLKDKGYEVFLPTVEQWSVRRNRRHCSHVPMFKGYLFLRHAVNKKDFIEISNCKGLVTILGARWDRLAHVPAKEVETIKLASQSRLPAMPYPYLEEGDKVKITQGSLANAEGILIKTDPSKGLFIISVKLLKRSIAVEVDRTSVLPV